MIHRRIKNPKIPLTQRIAPSGTILLFILSLPSEGPVGRQRRFGGYGSDMLPWEVWVGLKYDNIGWGNLKNHDVGGVISCIKGFSICSIHAPPSFEIWKTQVSKIWIKGYKNMIYMYIYICISEDYWLVLERCRNENWIPDFNGLVGGSPATFGLAQLICHVSGLCVGITNGRCMCEFLKELMIFGRDNVLQTPSLKIYKTLKWITL